MKKIYYGSLVCFISIIVGLMMFVLVGCDDKLPNEASEHNEYILEAENDNYVWTPIYTLTDKETGVEYIVIHGSNCVCITPRYDADGKLKKAGD